MDLIQPTLNCLGGFGLVIGLVVISVFGGLFFYRWLDEQFEGWEDVSNE